jgi:hypothetical protein
MPGVCDVLVQHLRYTLYQQARWYQKLTSTDVEDESA